MNRDLERFLNEAFEGHARWRASVSSDSPSRAELLRVLLQKTSNAERVAPVPGISGNSIDASSASDARRT
jgi:hypothetical protein